VSEDTIVVVVTSLNSGSFSLIEFMSTTRLVLPVSYARFSRAWNLEGIFRLSQEENNCFARDSDREYGAWRQGSCKHDDVVALNQSLMSLVELFLSVASPGSLLLMPRIVCNANGV